jgi:hypothetical protein
MLIALTPSRMVTEIAAARERVVFAGPGMLGDTARAVANAAIRLSRGRIRVVLDCDDRPCRLGYGEIEAIRILRASGCELHHAPGLRIGALVVDERAWTFSPAPLCVEADRQNDESPNAVRLSAEEANNLVAALCPEKIAGSHLQLVPEVGGQPVTEQQLQETEQSLKEAPPLQFDLQRHVMVYSPYIQYVELSLGGCAINRQKVQIPRTILNLAPTNSAISKRITTTFNLIGKSSRISAAALEKVLREIRSTYLRHLSKHGGPVMLRSKRTEFDRRIEGLRKQVSAHQERVKKRIDTEIERSINQIVPSLVKLLIAQPPAELRGQIASSSPTKQEAARWLYAELKGCFPSADQVLRKMELQCRFKDVTYEILKQDGFLEELKNAFPAVSWDKPVREFQAVEGEGKRKEVVD